MTMIRCLLATATICCLLAIAPASAQVSKGPAEGTTTIPTYVGDLTYQHQTLSKPSAEKLHRQTRRRPIAGR